jgi:hypothetical protein
MVRLKIREAARAELAKMSQAPGGCEVAFSLDDVADAAFLPKPKIRDGVIQNEEEIRRHAIAAINKPTATLWRLECVPIDLSICSRTDLFEADGFAFVLRAEMQPLLNDFDLDFRDGNYLLVEGPHEIKNLMELVKFKTT